MNIDQARTNRTHLMNVTDMLKVTGEADSPVTTLGEKKSVMMLLRAYYGGFNVGSDTSAFDRLRSNA